MRFSFLLGFSIAAFTLIYGQETDKATIEWGAELSDNEDGSLAFKVGEHGGDAILVFNKRKTSELVRMSVDRERLASKEYNFEHDGDDLWPETMKIIGDKLFQFANFYEKKTKLKQLYLRVFDAHTLEVVQDWKVVAELVTEKRKNQGNFEVYFSPDESKIVIIYHSPNEKDEPEKFEATVLNYDLSKAWNEVFTLEYADEDLTFSDFIIDDDGTLLVLTKVNEHSLRESKQMSKGERSPYEYHLLVFEEGSPNATKDFVLKLGDKFLQEMFITIPSSGDKIYCNGFYSENGQWSIRGSYFMSLDRKSKEVLNSNFHEYEDDFITMYLTEKEEKKASKKADRTGGNLEMADLRVREVIVHESGGLIIVSEQYDYWITRHTVNYRNSGHFTARALANSTINSSGVRTATVRHYLYRDIVVHRVDAEGKLVWKNRIPKNQYTRDDGGYALGFTTGLKNGELFLVFNDNEKNLCFQQSDILQRMLIGQQSSIISMVTLNIENGEIDRELMVDVEKRDMICIPKKSFRLGDQLLLVAENRKRNKFGTVTFH